MSRRSADVIAAACLVLLIVVLYADILFLGRGLYAFGVEDLLGYHIPMKWVVRDIVEHGAFPYWNIEPFTAARGDVLRVNETPNTIALDVRASGPAFLIVSATAQRYWSATIDGSATPLIPTDITYQGIRVPAGTHHVEMRYRNPWILQGAIVSLLALAALAFTASGGGMPRRASSRA